MPSPKVFISYKSADREWCLNLAERLRLQSVDVWFDQWEIADGDSILGRIREGLRDSGVLLLVLTPASAAPGADWVWMESENYQSLLLSGRKEGRLIPLLLEGGEVPEYLARLKYVDFRDEARFEEGFAELVGTITGGRARRAAAPPPGPLGFRKQLRADEFRVLVPAREILAAGLRLNYVPRGTFPMGSDEGYEHERPRHRVGVSAFFMSVTPVTNVEFDRFAGEKGYVTTAEASGAGLFHAGGERWEPREGVDWRHPRGEGSSYEGKENHPVVQVSWFDAAKYCEWLAKLTGLEFSLPTQAQWEYAAAGTRGRVWAFGDAYEPGLANLEGRDTTPVGRYAPNEAGLYDLTGNVYEWCADWASRTWAEAGHDLAGVTPDPKGPPAGRERVLKGGSWFDTPEHGRNANRFSASPSVSTPNWGFRCALAVSDELLDRLRDERRWGLSAVEMLR